MSDPRRISPLLDGFLTGEAISCHNGIQCYPAIRLSTGQQYIVKIISIPASQLQLAALLLTGAYASKDDASNYFLELSRDIVKEKGLLSDLSRLEGFCEYSDCQVVAMEEGIGFEVYLLSPYRNCATEMLSDNRMTHLDAINLGLDLCTALAACRRAGYLYIDLKPSNVFYTVEHGYRIGDLGFVSMNSLSYTALPEKYLSDYTPEEVRDPMAVLNSTVDIYALGLILYQAYNGGALPETNDDGFAPPMYADYEMSEIILKACAAAPEDRWQDPVKLGQALVSYMQRNAINDAPIIPPALEQQTAEVPEEPVEEFLPEKAPAPEELAFLQTLTNDETAPSEETTADLDHAPLTDEGQQMLQQAEELLAHEPPPAVVAAAPDPDVLLDSLEDSEEEFSVELTGQEEIFDGLPEADPEPEFPSVSPTQRKKGPRWVGYVATGLIALLLLSGCFAGLQYYKNVYLQNVESLIVSGTEEMLTVQIVSEIDETLLTVICTDSYGNQWTSSVDAGVAVFRQLDPQTRYSIRLEISGKHKLTGMTTTSFTTASLTKILDLTAKIGPEDGSVLLSFGVEGTDSKNWTVTYSARGVDPKNISFSGHSVVITELMIGAEYTFTLRPEADLYIAGQSSVQFTASQIIFAQNLSVPIYGGGSLTVSWNAPEGVSVESWTVRCYNESGYDKTLTVSGTSCTFTELDHSTACTVEVFAAGMNQCEYITVAPDPLYISAYHFDAADGQKLQLRWSFTGAAPAGGWILQFSINGTESEMLCSDSVALLPATAGGVYFITLLAADGTTVYGGTTEYTLPEA